jgi:hypothetical protein
MLAISPFLAYLSRQYSTEVDNLKRFFFLFILLASLVTTSCIPAAIGVASWYMSVTDAKQIQADKTECEEKAMNIIEGRKEEIQTGENTEKKISAIDQIFQKEFTSCMKAKAYYKASAGNETKTN